MLAGMAAGVVVLVVVWWNNAVAWTWYAFIGASITCAVALAFTPLLSRRADAPARS